MYYINIMDNVGLLMHKLTKYQTLYAHGTDKDKKKVYGQKINYYTQKLTNMGMSKSNLAELGRLTGGAITDDITANITNAVETLRKKLEETSKSQEEKQKEVSERVKKAGDDLETVKTNYSGIVDNVINIVTTVKKQLDKLATEVEGVKDIAVTGIPETVDTLIKHTEELYKLVNEKEFNKLVEYGVAGTKHATTEEQGEPLAPVAPTAPTVPSGEGSGEA